MSTVAFPTDGLLLPALALLINGVIALLVSLRFARGLAIAAARMIVQVAVMGLALQFVLAQTSAAWTALVALAMVLLAGLDLAQHRHAGGWMAYGLGNATLLLVGGLCTLYAAAVVAGPTPWHAPSTLLPMLGMVLGTALTSISLALQALAEGAERERAAIEARIALGAGRIAAFSGVLKSALRTATTPLVNMMALAGLAGMPGFLAGQMVAGTAPVEAAKNQISVMLVLAGAAALGALTAALGSVLLMTDRRHRLRLDRLSTPPHPAPS